jgi:hypothetical protein
MRGIACLLSRYSCVHWLRRQRNRGPSCQCWTLQKTVACFCRLCLGGFHSSFQSLPPFGWRASLFLLSVVSLLGKTCSSQLTRNLYPQMRLQARPGDVEAQLIIDKEGQDFASLTSEIGCMAAASCARSLLIYLAFDGCGLPNLGGVAKVMVRHGTPHCGPTNFTPKALTWSGVEEHGRPHVVTKLS